MLEYSTQETEIKSWWKEATSAVFRVFPEKEKVDVKFNQIHTFWNDSKTLDHVSLVAIGGGVNDIQVSK